MKLRQAVFLALVALCACRRPDTSLDDTRLNLAAKVGSMAIPEHDRPEYLQGFFNGAQMVESALKFNQRPFLPRIGSSAGTAIPMQRLPAGAQVQVEIPKMEMDPETGLLYIFLYADDKQVFPKGQMEGFRWAFEGHRAVLTQPKPVPPLPSAWEDWSIADGLVLRSATLTVECNRLEGLLAWSIREQGFPPRRRWRPLPEAMRPQHAALSDDALWVDTTVGAFAIDLETGAIRNIMPTQPHEATSGSSSEAILARWKEGANRERPGLLAKAQAGDTKAMIDLGYIVDDEFERARWYRQAAEAGDPQGMYEWAILLYQGRGVAEDRLAARAWFEKAVVAGHQSARAVLDGLFSPK